MNPGDTIAPPIPRADLGFLEVFLPYELRLAQRRAMVWGSLQSEHLPNAFIGLYVLRLETATAVSYPAPTDGGDLITAHVWELLTEVLRDSDIPVSISDRELLAVLRDIDPEHAYVVAQRMLGLAARSELLQRAGVRTRIGYVIYPLSFQPNFPAESWRELLDIARAVSGHDHVRGPAAAHGILRGPRMAETSITEADLVALIQKDTESLVKAGLLQLQKIHMSGDDLRS